jgi:DNA-binding response OmpR family regulator
MSGQGTRPTAPPRALVVDDHADLRALLRILLERAGAEVVEAADGRAALRALYAERPDLVVLDVDMPVLDGWGTLERIREVSDVPVLMLTGSGSELDKVRGLRAGADDYVTKPFGRQELLARVEALLRRARREAPALAEVQDDGLVRIDHARRAVEVGGRPVALTPLEFRLLAAFVRHPHHVLSRDQLLDLVWGDATLGTGDQVKLYVSYLRRKLAGATPVAPIETVRGFGYCYRPARSSASSASIAARSA